MLQTHHEGESWGLALATIDEMIYTCGDDNKILAINYHTRKIVNQGKISLDGNLRDGDKGKQSTAATLSMYPPH